MSFVSFGFKNSQRKNSILWRSAPQSGRSLTEMLGVLAIIGVLSIAALLGFQFAIDKYRTNETVQELNRRYIVLSHQYMNKSALNQEEFGLVTKQGYPIVAGVMTDETLGFYQELSAVPEGVCKQLIKSDYPAILSVNGHYLGDSGAVCADENTLRFIYVTDIQWCVKLDESGNCCDTKGRCCSTSKPMINSAGQCISCEGAQSINLGSYAYTCDRCENRQLVPGSKNCAKVCPDGQYRDSGGQCHACDEVSLVSYEKTPANIAQILACPKMTLETAGIARHCDVGAQSIGVSGYPETCAKCTNRELVNAIQCAKVCPDGQYRDSGAQCHTCDEVRSVWIDTTPYNLDRIRACPKMVLSNGLTANNGMANHCDIDKQSIGADTPAECAKCENRQLVPGTENCVLKPVSRHG